MSDDRRRMTPESGQIQIARSAFYREAYATNFRFRLSPVDFTITFATNTDILAVPVQDEAAVTMSIPAAKILLLHLQRMIAEVEHEIGPIRIPKRSIPTEQQMQALLSALKENSLVEP